MSLSLLGVHFIPTHTGAHHYDYIRSGRPGIVKTVGGEMPDVQVLADVYAAAPDAVHYWRNHALSEQHADVWSNPAATGKRHAQEMVRDANMRYQQAAQRELKLPSREQVRLLGLNEPITELFRRLEDRSNLTEWTAMMNQRAGLLDAYMFEFGVESNRLGYGTGLGNFSSGQPANPEPGAYPTFRWFPRTIALLESTRSLNALAIHEYFDAAGGPEAWWDWHTCRFFHYELNADIVVLEAGIDQGILGQDNHGWQGLVDIPTYMRQIETYMRRAMTDSRFKGATPFSLDGGGRWKSFYLEPAMSELAVLGASLTRSTQHTAHVPIVVTPPAPTPTPDTWQRAREFVARWEGGFVNNPADPGGATNMGITLNTLTAWRTARGLPAATVDDVRNLTRSEADAIYHANYWQASGADKLPWPAALVVFDTAVLHGTGMARTWWSESRGNVTEFLARRLESYTRMAHWQHFGAGWTRRVADLLREVA